MNELSSHITNQLLAVCFLIAMGMLWVVWVVRDMIGEATTKILKAIQELKDKK